MTNVVTVEVGLMCITGKKEGLIDGYDSRAKKEKMVKYKAR